MPLMTKTVVDFVCARGAEPFLVPAMGSHGGATAEGQVDILRSLGITEEAMGCKIYSDMDPILLGEATACRSIRTVMPLKRMGSFCSTG